MNWNFESNKSRKYLDVVHLEVLLVEASDQKVVGDVVQVATELQPGTGGGDVVSGALALDLDQDLGVVELLTVPGVEWLEELEAVGLGVDNNGVGGAVGWWVSVVVLALEPALNTISEVNSDVTVPWMEAHHHLVAPT